MSTKCPLQPLADRVVIEKSDDTKKEQVVSGIILPESDTKDIKNKGIVVACGTDVKQVSVGDTVVYTQYSGDDSTIDDTDYSILKEEQIIAIITN